jgi:glucose-1-phosphate cytidylyltransferase
VSVSLGKSRRLASRAILACVIDTVILCGGKGTRAYPHTIELPKPLLQVDGRPVLHHVLDIYVAQGFDRFILAAGYRCDMVEAFAKTLPPTLRIDVRDTGEDTNTGGRIWRCRDSVGDTFFATYADGLGNVDLRALLDYHRSHPGAATLTAVALPSHYGTIDFDPDNRVQRFREKPTLPDHRVNAGFFVFDRRVFDLWDGEDLERDVLPSLAAAGELFAYQHHGFWKSMDTYKESVELSDLCRPGPPPWLVSEAATSDDAADATGR